MSEQEASGANDTHETQVTLDSVAPSVAQTREQIVSQMRDSLRLYQWWQCEIEECMSHGVGATPRMLKGRNVALREYLECARVIQMMQRGTDTTSSSVTSAADEAEADAYRLIPDDILTRLLQETQQRQNDSGVA